MRTILCLAAISIALAGCGGKTTGGNNEDAQVDAAVEAADAAASAAASDYAVDATDAAAAATDAAAAASDAAADRSYPDTARPIYPPPEASDPATPKACAKPVGGC